jgi:hypothetical protein
MALATGLRRMRLEGRKIKPRPLVHLDIACQVEVDKARWASNCGMGEWGMRTKCGSRDALDFGLEESEVRKLVLGVIGSHSNAGCGFSKMWSGRIYDALCRRCK